MAGAPRPIDPAELIRHGLSGTEIEIRLVHGSTYAGDTPGIEDLNVKIDDRGDGDFGRGFYTFLADGSEAAVGESYAERWATDKAKWNNGRPCIVHLTIPAAKFVTLTRREITSDEFSAFVAQNRRVGAVLAEELIFGPVAYRKRHQWIPNDDMPNQYRFTAKALDLLKITNVDKR